MCTTNARVMDGSKNHKQLYYRIPTAEFLSLLRRGSCVRIATESRGGYFGSRFFLCKSVILYKNTPDLLIKVEVFCPLFREMFVSLRPNLYFKE